MAKVRKFRRTAANIPESLPPVPEAPPDEEKTPANPLPQEASWPPGTAEFETSESIDALAAAFVEFRKSAPNLSKDTQGYNYTYTSLATVIETLQPHLSKHGLAVTQFPISGPQGLGVITVLLHRSGQYIRSRFLLPIPSLKGTNITQDAGAAITYARRYGISSVLCVASEEDTDARYRR